MQNKVGLVVHGDDKGGGFRQGSLSACVFYHEQKNVSTAVHGDDFTAVRPGERLD